MSDTVSIEEYNKVVAERDALIKEVERLNHGLNSWKLIANMCRDEIARLDANLNYKANRLLHTEPTLTDKEI